MYFDLSKPQQLFADSVRDFCQREFSAERVRELMETESATDDRLWQELADQGWLGLHISEDNDGLGLGTVDLAVLSEEFGRACVPGPWLACTWAATLLQNSSEVLQMSVSQVETYRRLARKALTRATVRGERPAVLHWGVTMQDAGRIHWKAQNTQFEKVKADNADDPVAQEQELNKLEQQSRQTHSNPYFRNLTSGRTVLANWTYSKARHVNQASDSQREIPTSLDHIAILPRGGNRRFTIELGNRVPDEGTLRVRVRASRASQDDAGTPTLELLFGWQASNEGRAVLPVPDGQRAVSADPENPQFYQWDVPLGEIYPRNSVRTTSTMGSMPNPSEYIRLVNSSVSQGPIRIDYVEVAAPVYDTWPPVSHRRIFIDSDNADNEQNSRDPSGVSSVFHTLNGSCLVMDNLPLLLNGGPFYQPPTFHRSPNVSLRCGPST